MTVCPFLLSVRESEFAERSDHDVVVIDRLGGVRVHDIGRIVVSVMRRLLVFDLVEQRRPLPTSLRPNVIERLSDSHSLLLEKALEAVDWGCPRAFRTGSTYSVIAANRVSCRHPALPVAIPLPNAMRVPTFFRTSNWRARSPPWR